jgi:hypothetical protein
MEWFTKDSCNIGRFVQVNEMNSKTTQWKNELKIEEKFQNFHGCTLTLFAIPFFGEMQEFKYSIDLFRDLYATIGKRGNFRLKYYNYYTKDHTSYDILYALPMITSPSTNLNFHFTVQFLEERASFFLTQREPYSAYEKLWLPFDDTTWIFFIAVFLYSFLSIFVINLMSENLQYMFYGENVNTPIFNVVGTFFGISQTRLPDANFPRILLMTFILYCLILRTAYQSLLFEYVATDMRKPSPTTIDELIDQKFTICSEHVTNDWLVQMVPEVKK